MRKTILSLAIVSFLAGRPAAGALLTVGPGGTHASVQSAVDAALASPGFDEIRVAAGTFFERVSIPDVPVDLRLSGGWDSLFLEQPEGLATVIDAARAGPVLWVRCSTGTVQVERLRLTGGRAEPSATSVGGAGVSAKVEGDCRLVLLRVEIRDNLMEKTIADGFPVQSASGGGVDALLLGHGVFELRDSVVSGNRAINRANGVASAGGALVRLNDSSRAELTGNQVEDNLVSSADMAHSGGLSLLVNGNSTLLVFGNLIRANTLSDATERPGSGGMLTAGSDGPCAGCRAELRRNQWLDNRGELFLHFAALAQEGATIVFGDSIIAGGATSGAQFNSNAATVLLTNLTIADHGENGLSIGRVAGGVLKLANTVVFGNGSDTVFDDGEMVDFGSVLDGVDPLFRDPAARDYRLRVSSPAIDRGNDAPRGGLGPTDVAGVTRVQGRHVDIGAHEAASAMCRATELGSPNPVPVGTRVCECFSEPIERVHRCSFLLRDSFFWVRIPVPPPFTPFTGEWSVLPWSELEGPFVLSSQSLLKTEWQPLPLGKNGKLFAEGKLAKGKVQGGKVSGFAFGNPVDLRFLLEAPSFQKKTVTWELELLLPVEKP